MRRFLPLVFALAVPVAGAPQLRDRPLDTYERQVTEGLVVFGGPLGWVMVKAAGPEFCEITADITTNRGETYGWVTTVRRRSVAEWLRDYPENRRAKP